jgi:tubulin-specific chaperone E
MSVRTLRLKLAKSFRLTKAEQAETRLWLRMPGDAYAEIEAAEDGRDLSWWGFENGSEVVLASS